jgi:hypothetical protein
LCRHVIEPRERPGLDPRADHPNALQEIASEFSTTILSA